MYICIYIYIYIHARRACLASRSALCLARGSGFIELWVQGSQVKGGG